MEVTRDNKWKNGVERYSLRLEMLNCAGSGGYKAAIKKQQEKIIVYGNYLLC